MYFIPDTEKDLPDLLQNHIYQEGGMAYICQGTTCYPPIKTAQELNFELEK